MSSSNRIHTALKAFVQLGPRPVIQNLLYRLGLISGWYRRSTRSAAGSRETRLQPLFVLPAVDEVQETLGRQGLKTLLAEADDITAGRVCLFGSEPVDLVLSLPGKLQHWTAYEREPKLLEPFYGEIPDVKFLWEPARFGWAFTLGRAWYLTHREKYAEVFWKNAELFLDANPPYHGPHWMSAQEVALRLMAFTWAAQVFGDAACSTGERLSRLAEAVADHASRIPPTLVYARSQGNNHLLTEAAGLLTAGLALPGHAHASAWRRRGLHIFDDALQNQIDDYGEYCQHSVNYQRLMLQTALWVRALTPVSQEQVRFSFHVRKKLAAATHWLLSLLDSDSGHVPNLGANDGAYIFPLTTCPFADYRPVVHAAARLFQEYDLPHGPWDEMALWFNLPVRNSRALPLPRYLGDNLYGQHSWAVLRTAQYTTRPSHADQLHLDLWWHGLNVALDPGTYLYNAPPPWENSLATALVHNTVTVNGRDQMTRAGRFLYLDWVNAFRRSAPAPADCLQSVTGTYRVYRRDGYRHSRSVTVFRGDCWLVTDTITPLPFPLPLHPSQPLDFRLHWLLPDWKWELHENEGGIKMHLQSPNGQVVLVISGSSQEDEALQVSLVRAGEVLQGAAFTDPIRGWGSPTYGVKVPALSLAVVLRSRNQVQFTSEFLFP